MFVDLSAKVHEALVKLQERQAIPVNDDVAQATVDAALRSCQKLVRHSASCEESPGKGRWNFGALKDRHQ